MIYTKEFLKTQERVHKLRAKLDEELQKLQSLCPHVTLTGRSAFPEGISFTDCTICGMSSYYV